MRLPLNTTEQISANTNNINLAGALALKAAIADYTNKISAISNLATKVKIVYTNAESEQRLPILEFRNDRY